MTNIHLACEHRTVEAVTDCGNEVTWLIHVPPIPPMQPHITDAWAVCEEHFASLTRYLCGEFGYVRMSVEPLWNDPEN